MLKNWNLLLLAVFLTLFTLARCLARPSKPQNLENTAVSSTTITLQWDPPNSLRKTTSYVITYNGVKVETRSTIVNYTLTALQPFTNYSISVAAINEAGVGINTQNIRVETAEAVPTQPLSLNITGTNTTVTLTWSQPEHPNGVITSYVITYNEEQVNTNDDYLSYTLTGLLPFKTYSISVAARNGAGIGNKTPEAMETTKKGYPSAPRNLMVTQQTCKFAKISWRLPQVVGDMPDTVKYLVDIAEEAQLKNTFSEMTSNRNHKARNLTAETTYKVTVRAQNSIGFGQLAMVTFKTQPYDLKTISSKRLTDSSIKIQVDISDPSEVYECLADAQGSDRSLTDTKPSQTSRDGAASFTDLESNTTYNIICTGMNNNCQGGNVSFTTHGVPSQPTDVIVQAVTCNSAMVTWSLPFHDGGSPVQEYQVQVKEGRDIVQSIPTVNESLFVHNIEVDTSYMVSIGSINSIGIGPFAMITFSTKSYDNAGITATSPSNTKIEVNIAIPQTYACSATDVDTADSSTNNITSTDGIGIFQELKSNTEYSINCIGVYNTCIIASTAATTRIGAPDPPTIAMSPTTTCQSIQLSWTPPTNTGGDAIRNYTVTYYMSGAEESKQKQTIITNQMSVTLNGLVPNTEYTVLVRASNSEQTGEAYSIAGTTDSRDKGDIMVAKIDSTSATLLHSLGNDVRYRCNTTGTSTDQFSITADGEYSLSGLSADTTYTVKCVAYEDDMEYCYEANTTFKTLPAAVTMLRTTGVAIHGDPNIAQPIAWQRPLNHNSTLKYVITYSKSEQANTTIATAGTSFNLSLPIPTELTAYTVSVAAESDVGLGEAVVLSIPYKESAKPGNIKTYSITCNSITVTWKAPVKTGGLELLRYIIEENQTKFSREVGPNETKLIVISNLLQNTKYVIQVSAVNSIGENVTRVSRSTTTKDDVVITATSPSNTEIKVNITTPQTYACSARGMDTEEYTHINTSTDGFGTFKELESNTEYSINCTGVDNACKIANTTATTRIGVPDPPTIEMTHTTTCQSIELYWTAPINTGGDDISNYTVTYYISVPGESEQIHTANTLSVTLNGLVPNTEYTVLVRASNSQQTGEAANITVKTKSRGNGDIMVSNTDSTSATLLHSLGNDAYYRCNITGTSTEQFNIPAVEGINLSGLSADTTYTVNCVAYEGDMDHCYEANTTFKTLPAAVTMLRTNGVAFHGNPNITQPIAWERPPQHTSTLTYVIKLCTTKESNTATVLKTDQTSINASLPLPTVPTDYTVSVAAESDVGLGEAEELSIPYKRPNLTAADNIQTHNITCNSITVTWEAPEDTGGLEVLRYRIEETKSGFSTVAGPNENGPILIPNLLQNTSYKIKVRAVNSIGASMAIRLKVTATKDNIKLNIIPVSATRMTVQITTPIDGADYSCTLSSQGHNPITMNTSTTNATFSNLQQNINYNVACLVYENRQELCYEGNGMGKTFPEVPDEPPDKVEMLETQSTAFTAAWSVPAGYEYYEDIIGYKVVYWTAGSQNMTNVTTNTIYTYTATGLVTDSVYYFIVAAVTAKGTGVYSDPIQAATIPIIPVEKLSFRNVTTDSFSIRWEGNYTGYSIHIIIEVVEKEFKYGTTEFNQTELSGDSTDFSVKGLAPFRQYQIDIYLTKPDENGTGSTVRKNVRTQAKKPEGKPKDTNTTSGARNVTLQWKIPSSAKRNGIITSYRIEWKSLGTVQAQKSPVIHNLTNPSFTHPADISYTLTSLTPYTNYKWRVAAVNDKGDGPFSEYHNFTTEEDAPGIVGTITYSPYNSSSGEVKWSKPTAPNGLITTYELCYWKLGTKCDSPSNTTNSTASQEYLNNFTPGVPHVVSVTAFTSAGRGAYSTIQMPFFSQELKPNTTVQNITVNRINSTTANISWIPLTLHEARGYPEYTVQIISGGVTEFEKNTTESSILANDLEARKVYTAQVQPVTAGGREGGPVSAVNFGRAPDEMEHDGIVIAIVIVLIILVALICIILIVIIVVFCKYKKNKGELLYDNEEMVPLKELVDESMVARQNMKKNNAIPKQQFSAHVRKMHLRKDSEFKEEFSDITREPPVGHEAAEANRTKNRYINIYPYDYSRVVLNKLDGSDYINAAFIDGYHGERRYIASQGPTPATVADFWEMVWEQQSTVIVMLTKLVEGTRVKCEQYWREDLNQPYEPGRDIRVTTTSHRVMTGFEARNITLEKTSEKSSPLKVKHFLYTAWPDHGVPQYSSSMVKFIQEQIRPEIQNSSSPIIVHCSAGAGRTGTLIAIDTAIDRLEEEEDINIFERVEFMRARRTQMVQNVNQYMYIHDAINDYVTCGNTTIVAHDLGKKIKVLNKTHPTTKMRGYDRQFQKLVDTSPEIDQTDLDFSQGADIAELNRYPDKIPYSDTEKHILTEDAEKYVNATEVKGYYGQNTFIAAQAPMKNTAEDIWNVIRERKCSVVVVLTNFRENEQEMCAEFWPSEVGVPMEIGYMKISLIQTDSSENFNKHNLSISVEEADILHKVDIYHYLSWVKDGCPNIPSLLKLMGEVQRSQQGDSEPVIVMCDDGMSRTGVFITVMSEIDRVKLEGEMDIFQTIKAARTARPYMVSTVKDFEYCHEIMQQYLESFDTYANFK